MLNETFPAIFKHRAGFIIVSRIVAWPWLLWRKFQGFIKSVHSSYCLFCYSQFSSKLACHCHFLRIRCQMDVVANFSIQLVSVELLLNWWKCVKSQNEHFLSDIMTQSKIVIVWFILCTGNQFLKLQILQSKSSCSCCDFMNSSNVVNISNVLCNFGA